MVAPDDGGPPPRRREDTRRRLITTGRRVFVEQGLDRATIEQVATEAGLTRGAFYSSYTSLEELLAVVFAETTSPRTRTIIRRNLTEPGARALVRALSSAVADAGDDEGLVLTVLAAVRTSSELAERIRADLWSDPDAADDDQSTAPPRRRAVRTWTPSTDGAMTDRDLDEVRLFAEHLRRWVELLPNDDVRLARAETLAATLANELRSDAPDRIIVRRCTQLALGLLADESATLASGLARAVRGALEHGSHLDDAFGDLSDAVLGAGATPPDEADWTDGVGAVDGEITALLEVVPDEAIGEIQPDDTEEPGRGSAAVRLLKWIGTTTAASGVGLLVKELAPAALRAVEHLWNVLGL